MYRLFVAVDLPEEVKQAVQCLCSGLPGVKWIDPGQLHLTLRFIGQAEDVLFSRLNEEIGTVAAESFQMTLRGVGCFPPRGDPRVLWVGVERNPELAALAAQIERAIVRAGVEPEPRPFSPHITTARLSGFTRGGIVKYTETHALFAAGPFPVREFHLYSSTLTPKGAIHKREATYPLR